VSIIRVRPALGHVLKACGLALVVGSASAQRPTKPVVKLPGSTPVLSGHIDVPETYVTGMDLYIADIGFTSDKHVRFTLGNRGLDSVTTPFVVDLYIAGERRDTYKVQRIGAKEKVALVSTLATAPSCGPVALRAVSDPQSVVAEHSENDNELTRTVTPPCPDLLVTDMRQDWQDANSRYRVQVTIANQGNSAVTVETRVRVNASGRVVDTPVDDWIYTPVLAPGQSITVHLRGVWLGTSTVDVVMWLDFDQKVAEQNEVNNKATKTFGPH
jgi:subtilase family serine protease